MASRCSCPTLPRRSDRSPACIQSRRLTRPVILAHPLPPPNSSGKGVIRLYRRGRAIPKTIDTINLQNFENARSITRFKKIFFPEKMTQKTSITSVAPWKSGITVCDPKSTKTTIIEELGYVYIVLQELWRMWWSKSRTL